jgi:hypothetical protein
MEWRGGERIERKEEMEREKGGIDALTGWSVRTGSKDAEERGYFLVRPLSLHSKPILRKTIF